MIYCYCHIITSCVAICLGSHAISSYLDSTIVLHVVRGKACAAFSLGVIFRSTFLLVGGCGSTCRAFQTVVLVHVSKRNC